MGCAAFVYAPDGYQDWNSYPDTPDLSSEYPYQLIEYQGAPGNIILGVCTSPYAIDTVARLTYLRCLDASALAKRYYLSSGAWVYQDASKSIVASTGNSDIVAGLILETNHDIYYGETLKKGYTTENPAGSGGIRRIKNMKRFNALFTRGKCTKLKGESGYKRVNV